MKGCADEAYKDYSRFLAWNKAKRFLSKIVAVTFDIVGNYEERGVLKKKTMSSKSLIETLQCDGLRVLMRLIWTYFVK